MNNNHRNPWNDISGSNMGYVFQQYEIYLENPDNVDESFNELFSKWGAPQEGLLQKESPGMKPNEMINKMRKLIAAVELASNIRKYGHLQANLNPLVKSIENPMLDLAAYRLTEADLRDIPAAFICEGNGNGFSDGFEAIQYLKKIYTSTVGFEVEHIEPSEIDWMRQKIEGGYINRTCSAAEKEALLKSLYEAEKFEQFIGKTYVGQKRFSVEGLESLVPFINELVTLSAKSNVNHVAISMAHRGRLNVLTHVLEKPYEAILSQFQHSKWVNTDPTLQIAEGFTGDVKYHLGAVKEKNIDGRRIKVSLAYNPSHLEIAGSVVEGYTRALQDDRSGKGYPKQDVDKAIPVLVHGDAAISGQGIVQELLNYARTKAYGTGGTIHIVANNHIGFTTESEDDRSTVYSSDVVKGYNIPVLHVNADDPEACLAVAKLAFEYRQTFHKDVLVDISGYRRLGHNEMDEPRMTSPVTYKVVDKHPTITAVYTKQLLKEESISEERIKEIASDTLGKLQKAYESIEQNIEELKPIQNRHEAFGSEIPSVETKIDKSALIEINDELLKWPEGFNVFNKLRKILNRRRDAVENHKKIDWGHAEALAFASILKDGTSIRLTGQDSERGTFSHRNVVLSDEITGEKYSPMHTISTSNASFDIRNSTLSENGVLGFEYGYDIAAPETLVMWEAQFGDFANGAQMIIDQFIASGREKWGQKSGLVLLLPHGYEGQGPEHSNARPERYLQLAAENNWTVANFSTAGNYFHALRRQAAVLKTEEVRPLVIMTPKSLLRHPSAGVYLEELTQGQYNPIMEQPGLGKIADEVERVVLTTGRIAVELSDMVGKDLESFRWLDIIRVEQLYPFPEEEIERVFNKYRNLKEIIWTQEEPQNMGAWNYIAPRIQKIAPKKIMVTYNGRPDMASPSEGDPFVHKHEQERIISMTLTKTKAEAKPDTNIAKPVKKIG
ncbi:2-oxoglutarate dehydrogenase E1 component [Oceanobacillus piezotolerans]|uniref:2-oxoglutarate dehydrogenase E1 component n=1 Tax=Oceanobacillus piezotolerans TaxID=2448030 RepID=A0A498D310_9BACI|nr:2-oxoglutarate dehydrogenase E1 component [Oceanobacillus piezotolerans]RLL42102.1 2-oxoglutarate dehydrogenase E1 component [Oceanobacillus piezotolerans]